MSEGIFFYFVETINIVMAIFICKKLENNITINIYEYVKMYSWYIYKYQLTIKIKG